MLSIIVKQMKLIIGLGNPSKKYESTRHNIGRMVADLLVKKLKLKFKKHTRTETELAEGQGIIIAKPTSFMNNSGRAVARVANYFDISTKNIVVVYDDLDLPLGTIRFRKSGSSGGHNGMQSVIDNLKTDSIARIRIGIGRPTSNSVTDYVLEPFTRTQLTELKPAFNEVVDLLLEDL